MSAKSLADAYERLKELRRTDGELAAEMPASVEEQLYEMVARGGGPEGSAEIIKKLDTLLDIVGEPGRSANLFRVLEIKTLADRVFGDEQRAEAWLRRPNASLSLQKPVDMLKDELGTAVVREMLEQIDHGIFA